MPAAKREQPDPWAYVTALAGGLAHEIRNPLSTINLNLQLLEEEWTDAKTARERRTIRKLQVLQKEIQRLSRILDDFLWLFHVEQLHLEPADINEVVAEIAEFVEPELARTGIALREQYAENLPLCSADVRVLKQALLNIVINAQQAMPDGGELILRTSAAEGFVDIDIIDTGAGIPPHIQSKLFEPFFSTKPQGSGLGLAMTRRIVEQHGGTVQFHSEPGRGTDFVIRLPVSSEAAKPAEQPGS